MKFKNKENEKIKCTDGRDFWISRSVAVCATIIGFVGKTFDSDSAFVLAVKRGSSMDNPNKYCLPCGYIDWNESGPEAILREVFEETNLNLNTISRRKSYNKLEEPWWVETRPSKDAKQNITLHYGAVYSFDKLPKVSNTNCGESECQEVVWLNIKSINSYEWAFNHDVKIIDFCLNSFKST